MYGLNVNISHRHERPRCRSSLLRRTAGLVFGVRVRSPGRAARYERMTILINQSILIEAKIHVQSRRYGSAMVRSWSAWWLVGGALERSAPCAPPERRVAPPEPQPGLAGPVRGAPWTSATAAGSRFSPDPTTGPTTPRRFSISHAARGRRIAAGPGPARIYPRMCVGDCCLLHLWCP